MWNPAKSTSLDEGNKQTFSTKQEIRNHDARELLLGRKSKENKRKTSLLGISVIQEINEDTSRWDEVAVNGLVMNTESI